MVLLFHYVGVKGAVIKFFLAGVCRGLKKGGAEAAIYALLLSPILASLSSCGFSLVIWFEQCKFEPAKLVKTPVFTGGFYFLGWSFV